MAGLLGGRAAEQLVFSEVRPARRMILSASTDIARAMVLRYGMSEALGHVAYDRDARRSFSRFSDAAGAQLQRRNGGSGG